MILGLVEKHLMMYVNIFLGFPSSTDGKESACNAGDSGSIPGWGRSPGEWNGNPLQYSCLENSVDRGAWWATVHGVAKSQHDWATNRFHFHICKDLLLGSLLSSIDQCACVYGSTKLFWLLLLYSKFWNQKIWDLQLCSYFSRLFLVFRVCWDSMCETYKNEKH